LWSLGIEEQFYLMWPLALWLTSPKWRLAVILGIVAGSFALNVALIDSNPEATFYLPFTRVWELAAGAALVGVTIKSQRVREGLSVVGAAGAVSFILFDDRTAYPGWAALMPVVGTSAAILAEGSFFNRTVLGNPVAAYIGRISYPLYLWHWPLLVFWRAYVFRPITPAEGVILIIISCALAILTYELIEKPIRARKLKAVKISLAGMGAVAVFATIVLVRPPRLPDEIERFASVQTGSAEWRIHECMLIDRDKDFAPNCVDAERPLIALWGDSAAGALMPGLRELQTSHPFGIAQFTSSGCSPLLTKTPGVKCLERNREVLRRLEQVRPKTVLLNALWTSHPNELKPTVDALRAIGVDRIIVLGIVPVWRDGLPNAVAVYFRRTREIIPERTALFVEPQPNEGVMKEMAESSGAEFVSLRGVLCDKDGCLTRVGSDLITSDWLHFTPAGSKYLINKIGPAILGQ
jgi:hypothetical protein